jgi:glycosyltransferase involved in cell wall biosynthesis
VRQPTATVLLPVHNAERSLQAAINSIFKQSFGDIELLVMDDGSSDGTLRVLNGCRDRRLRVVRKSENQGLIAALNEGIQLARSPYIARMDADDIAHPRRLELQLACFDAHPDVGICGTWFRVRGGWRRTVVRTPVSHEAISARLFFRSPFAHPTVMFRRSFLEESGLRYDPQAVDAEDFDLWTRARERTRFANVPRVLLDYHVHEGQTSARRLRSQLDSAGRVRLRQLAALMPRATPAEQSLHLRACDGHQFASVDDLVEAQGWLDRLAEANRSVGLFPERAFGEALDDAWSHCCLRSTALPPAKLIGLYFSRRYTGSGRGRLREHIRVTSKAILRPAR